MFAGQRLTERGFEVFLPRVATGRSILPLFRSYFFCRIAADSHWRAIETTLGVLNLIKFGDAPARCPSREVEALMDRVDPDGVIRLPAPPIEPRQKIPAGAKVKVIAGPLQGVEALHSGMTQGEREILLVAMLGRPARSPFLRTWLRSLKRARLGAAACRGRCSRAVKNARWTRAPTPPPCPLASSSAATSSKNWSRWR
jgi:transcriptional antiterminator RfaH